MAQQRKTATRLASALDRRSRAVLRAVSTRLVLPSTIGAARFRMRTSSSTPSSPDLGDPRKALALAEARASARERGGSLLSEQVENSIVKLSWQCAHGHCWQAPLRRVKQGNWCPTCAGRGTVTIEAMRRLAAERRGRCLSTEYVNRAKHVQWQCAKGHRWRASAYQIHRSWCPFCARTRKLELKELRKIARRRGGRLLSTHYVDARTPLRWRCAEGHVWKACAGSVKGARYRRGSWCPKCAPKDRVRNRLTNRLTIEDMQRIARSRGGECLSERYVNGRFKLKWRCVKRHEWMARPSNVKSGSWCPVCCRSQKLTLAQLRETAAERGGKLISTEYANSAAPLLWECREGHRWEACAANVRQGSWCPDCAGRRRLTLEEMQILARAWGGECLSRRYVNGKTPLKWRCARGHVWKARANRVKPMGYQKRGSWCPTCAHVPKYRIEDMQELARKRGGACLSRTYVNTDLPLRWRCGQGHVWKTVARVVIRGAWCPICAARKSAWDKQA